MTGKRVGLVIGNNYPNSNKELRFAVADALSMKEVLLNKNICGFDDVEESTDGTFLDARIKIERILKNANHGDLIFIYFSGHGKKHLDNGLRLLFKDTNEDYLLATSLNFDYINRCIRYPSQKSVIIVLDCCYSGVAGIRDADVMEALKKYSGSGTIILSSTGLTGSPAAREEEKFGHGVFTHYLIEGLERGYADKKSNGYISIEDLYKYAFEKTKDEGYQSPKIEGSIEGSIFIGRNPQKIREKEYNSKKSELLSGYVRILPPLILNESLTILRKAYDVPPSFDPVEETIYDLLSSLLKSELQPENYSDAVQHLTGISISSESSRNKNKVDKSSTAVSKSENKEFPVNFEEPDTPKTFTSSSTGMEFVLIPAGKFTMGSPSDEQGRYDDEGPAHEVIIKNPFYLGKYPVTQKQWIAVMGGNPSHFIGDDLPVENISWNDVQEFTKKLTEMENTDKYRLPSEAEWEYACRAGTTTKYSFGDGESKLEDYAWYFADSDGKTHPVGQKQPNPLGLHDMHGNVWEWVQDRWHDNYDSAPSDGSAWEYGNSSIRVFRGGGWNDVSRSCRSAIRERVGSGSRSGIIGFRLLRKL
jgi:formylglycine-generating enzyme required for sulfatase activity